MPSKKHFINKFREDQEVSDLFLVHLKQLSSGRTGRNYLRLTIGDRTGKIEARVWEGAEELAQRFNQGDLVYVTGLVTSYQGVLQIKATYVELLDKDTKVDWADFLPSSERPAGEMWEELTAILRTVKNHHVAALLDAFLSDADMMEDFRRAPAALAMHHAYISGLLEHTLGVVRLADAVSGLYPVDRDLLIAGAFFHDIGKLEELSYNAGFDYTNDGRMLGHLIIGYTMVRERAATIPGFPKELANHLEHLLLSHHGELAWGSPKRPKTLEALMLHALDNIDAKICAAGKSLSDTDERDTGWTSYLKMFDRPLLRTPEFPGTEEVPETEATTPPPPQPKEPEPESAAPPIAAEPVESIAEPSTVADGEKPEKPAVTKPVAQPKLLI